MALRQSKAEQSMLRAVVWASPSVPVGCRNSKAGKGEEPCRDRQRTAPSWCVQRLLLRRRGVGSLACSPHPGLGLVSTGVCE